MADPDTSRRFSIVRESPRKLSFHHCSAGPPQVPLHAPSVPGRLPSEDAGTPSFLIADGLSPAELSQRARLAAYAFHTGPRASTFRGLRKADGGKWAAFIGDNQLARRFATNLGTYADQETAARAYDLALVILGNEPINFPRQHYSTGFPPEALERSLRAIGARLGLGPSKIERACRELTSGTSRP